MANTGPAGHRANAGPDAGGPPSGGPSPARARRAGAKILTLPEVAPRREPRQAGPGRWGQKSKMMKSVKYVFSSEF